MGAFSGGYKIRPYMHTLPFPAVGAHSICARTAPPGLAGLRSTGPGQGGMWACRPTRLERAMRGISRFFYILCPIKATHTRSCVFSP